MIYVNKNVSPTEYVYKEVDHTPYWSFRSVVNRDVMDAVDAGQVDPPGGGTGTSWHDVHIVPHPIWGQTCVHLQRYWRHIGQIQDTRGGVGMLVYSRQR